MIPPVTKQDAIGDTITDANTAAGIIEPDMAIESGSVRVCAPIDAENAEASGGGNSLQSGFLRNVSPA